MSTDTRGKKHHQPTKPRTWFIYGFLLIVASLAYFFATQAATPAKKTPLWETSVDTEPATQAASAHQTSPPQKPYREFSKYSSFVFYNLKNYLEQPPRRPGLASTSKSEAEITRLLEVLRQANPAVLTVCEIGTLEDLTDLQQRLKQIGIWLPHLHLADASDPLRHSAILSRFPITAHPYHSPIYTLEGRERTVRRGILDVTLSLPGHQIRLLGLHLKSKRPSPHADHNQIRRHEARLVRQHIESILESDPQTELILYGDLNDSKQSPSVKAIRGSSRSNKHLEPITLEASDGSKWTHYWAHEDSYSRIDFILANPNAKAHISLPTPSLLPLKTQDNGSDHRALHILLGHD